MKKLLTEYLVILSRHTAQATYNLCQTVVDFNRLVVSDPEVSIDGKMIRHKDQLQCNYQVATNTISGADGQRFFHIQIEFAGAESAIEDYTKLLKSIRTTAHSVGHCETIWDDVALHYSQLSYPLIHQAESLMRKLITYFMLTTIGKDWTETMSPNELKEALEKSKGKNKRIGEKLHQVDFIVLKDVLFKPYPNKPISDLYISLSSKAAAASFSLEQLQEYLPKSNWDRYFSAVVECDGAHIERVWKELYDLRCEVAHNALIGRSQYERISQLVDDVARHLQTAIEKNIGQVHVPPTPRTKSQKTLQRISAPSMVLSSRHGRPASH